TANGSLNKALSSRLPPGAVAIISEDGIAHPSVIESWTRENGHHAPVTWTWEGVPVAAVYPDRKDLLERLAAYKFGHANAVETAFNPESAELKPMPPCSWQHLRNQD